MPKGTKVHKCVERLTSVGEPLDKAIRICQESTGQSYKTGKPPKKKRKK